MYFYVSIVPECVFYLMCLKYTWPTTAELSELV